MIHISMHKRMPPHGDYNHMGKAIILVNNFKVEKVILNCGEFNDLETELIKVINPKYSIISVGKTTKYSHPNK